MLQNALQNIPNPSAECMLRNVAIRLAQQISDEVCCKTPHNLSLQKLVCLHSVQMIVLNCLGKNVCNVSYDQKESLNRQMYYWRLLHSVLLIPLLFFECDKRHVQGKCLMFKAQLSKFVLLFLYLELLPGLQVYPRYLCHSSSSEDSLGFWLRLCSACLQF